MSQHSTESALGVDPDVLAAIATRLRELRARLDVEPADTRLDVPTSGSDLVSGALEDFTARCAEGRQRIGEELEAVAAAFDASAAKCLRADHDGALALAQLLGRSAP